MTMIAPFRALSNAGRMISRKRCIASRSPSQSISKLWSSTVNPQDDPPRVPAQPTRKMESHRDALCQAALDQVPHHGWTNEAVTAAVVQNGWAITMAGMITPSDLVSYWMDHWNDQLEAKLGEFNSDQALYEALKFRLELVVPLVKSGRWHEGMALGLRTPITTRAQLHRIIELVAPNASLTQQASLGAIYASTEMHLLADSSSECADTWNFLHQRVAEYQSGSQVLTGIIGEVPMAVTSAVAFSLVEGIASLLSPSSSAAPMSGSSPDDYQAKH